MFDLTKMITGGNKPSQTKMQGGKRRVKKSSRRKSKKGGLNDLLLPALLVGANTYIKKTKKNKSKKNKSRRRK